MVTKVKLGAWSLELGAQQTNKYKFLILILVIIQIFLLMNSTIAQSYEIHKTDRIINQEIVKTQKEEKIKGFLIGLFSIKQIGSVSATSSFFNTSYQTTNYAAGDFSIKDSGWSCCEETKKGAICQNVATVIAKDSCDNPLPTKCENTASCKIGCCYDEEQGLCSTKSPKSSCENNNGKWAEEKNCIIPECEKGCCVLGANVEFTTERRCEALSLMQGREKNFKDSLNELQCIAISTFQVEGACILSGNTCKFTTQSECAQKEGGFNPGVLCSNPKLNTTCIKQNSINCVEERDEIFWFDSCGNQENIYSSDKISSWNNGFLLPKEKSCNPTKNNINSKTCGNCDYSIGSKCASTNSNIKINDGNFVCQNMKCIDEKNKVRENGESWCVYDSVIGNGLDVAGSRHWKRICIDGNITVEPCADYRGQICVQSEIKNKEGKQTTQAQCIINDAVTCIGYNKEKNMPELCKENTDCLIKNINVDEGFKFDMCVGQYPKGFDVTYEKGKDSAKALCGMANQECVAIWEKKISGWTCIFNCECETKKFTEQMNDLCISMGDCGAYVNIEGKGTNSYLLEENDNKVSWKDYTKNSEPEEGKYISPKELNKAIDQFVGQSEKYDGSNNGTKFLSDLNTAITYASTIAGATGVLVATAGGIGPFGFVGTSLGTASYLTGTASTVTPTLSVTPAATMYSGGATVFPTTTTTTTGSLAAQGGVTSTTTTTTTTGGVSYGTTTTTATEGVAGAGGNFAPAISGTLNAIGVAGAAIAVGTVSAMIANWAFGLSGDAAMVTTLVGAGAGLIVGLTAYFGGFVTSLAGCLGPQIVACLVAAVIIVVIVVITALIMKLLGIGEIKEVHVKYTCLPWQAPFGADDCSKCNEDKLKPCSEYRCNSLGKACGLINKNTENPLCVARESDDGLAPEIKLKEVSKGFKFTKESETEYKITTEEEKCIPEFTSVIFTLETNEYAQCKFDLETKEDYESMSQFLMEENMFEKNHTGGYMMPSLSSLEIYNLSGDIKDKLANTKINIKCIDEYENYNKKDFVLDFCLTNGKDVTPPTIVKTNPVNKAYVKRGLTELPLSIYLNEPANCNLDTIDRDYDIMQGEMECNTNITSMTAFGWECKTTLTGLSKEKNTLYIKCKDQPWLEDNENVTENRTRNLNSESTEYILYTSKSELKIDSISPSGEIDFGQIPASINLKVTTSGGFDLSGRAKCQYSFVEGEKMTDFYETYSSEHTQSFDLMESKEYNIFIKCTDDAGNTANKTASFKVKMDNFAPQIIRMKADENKQNIILKTNEEARCYYSTENCEFNLENATEIDSKMNYDHILSSSEGIKYYIKCEDKWNNKNAYCALIVSDGGVI